MKFYISQAFSLSKVEERVTSLLYQLYLHYLKVKLCPNHSAQNHWKSEIFNYVAQIRVDVNNVKTSSGKVKEGTLAKWFLSYISKGLVEDQLEYLLREYGESSIKITEEQVQAATWFQLFFLEE